MVTFHGPVHSLGFTLTPFKVDRRLLNMKSTNSLWDSKKEIIGSASKRQLEVG